tara:strand:+ start:808 stop:1128 length:321 start_codon:yes stop_codon:yes gene_type:complete
MKITKRQLVQIIKEAVADNVHLKVIDGNGEQVDVHIPYYIITDALEDGLALPGLHVEIEDYIQGNYYLNAWDFTEQSEKEIEGLHRSWEQGGVWSDEDDWEAGWKR